MTNTLSHAYTYSSLTNNPVGPIVENSDPGTLLLFLTLPEGEIEAEGSTSGVEADTEDAEDTQQDELNSPAEETEGYSVDPWPEINQAIEEAFNQQYED